MKVIPQQEERRRDLDGLVSFLDGCREEARRHGSFRIASITLRVDRLDPLAVLESIFEPGELHFYFEKSARETAVAGADAVVSVTVDGAERFRQAKAFVSASLERTICIGDMDAPFAGPHFFVACSFLDNPGEGSAFPGATVFLPRWQVAREGDRYTAVANLEVDPDADVEALAAKVWRAHAKFSAFDYQQAVATGGSAVISPVRIEQQDTHQLQFEEAVRKVLGKIRAGTVEKVVLSRVLDLDLPAELNPLHALNRLRMAYANCFTYSVANGRGQSFIGASPELLVRRVGKRLETEALAGSAPRGRTASEDASFSAQLLHSEKDAREHRVVIDSIRRRLERLPIELQIEPSPRLLQLANVQHLRTAISGTIGPGLHLFDILTELHPTPAVGGTPRAEAREAIRELEPFSRGLYAGAIGWINGAGDGEFTVAIRSTLIDGAHARLFAGAGIVAGSDPAREWQETEVKLKAVLDVLRQADA
jgi:menaquinone-specific isochorismate synthase